MSCIIPSMQFKTIARKRINLHPEFDWLILTLLIFIPRLLHLNVFLTADEPLFLEHARQFAAAIAAGDFAQTAGIGYPGVTVAAWVAPVINLPQTELGAYVAGRVATGLLTAFLMLLLFALSRVLLGRRPAFIGVALLALDPYSLAYGRLLHIAGPLSLFITLSGISLLLWLRDSRSRWLLLTGVFTGFALLTKSTALLLGPMLGVLVLAWAMFTGRRQNGRWWLQKMWKGLLIAALAMVVFFLFWPAMWIAPVTTLTLTFGKLFNDQQAGTGNLGLFWMGQFVQDPGPLFYPVAFLLKATPWLLVGLILGLFQLPKIFKQQTADNTQSSSPDSQSLIPCLWLFALTYLILMTIASKKSIRYMLPAFPTFYLLAGAAYHQFAQWLTKRIRSRQKKLPVTPAPHTGASAIYHSSRYMLIFIPLFLFTFIYHPYYFTYYNPALLGWKWAPQTLLVGWGEGLDGAANYLNQRTTGPVSAWYEWLFPLLYHGPVNPVVPQENMLTANDVTLYINQVQRDIPGPNIIHYFRTRRQPAHTVRLNGIDYAWVYPGPVAGFGPAPSPQVPLTGNFGDEMQLLGYTLHYPNSHNSIIVTLNWRVQVPPLAERFVFLRLVDEQGHIWAKSDGPPVMGLWPVSKWQPQMLIEDAHELPLPAGTPPGNYRLEVGVYDVVSGQPLAATGQPLGQGGGLLLGEVPVEWQPVQQIDTDVPNPVDVPLSKNVNLAGYSLSPLSAAVTGDLLPVEFVWRKAQSWLRFGEIWENYILFEWRKDGKPQAEQLDPLPLPVDRWGSGAVLRSQHNVIVSPSLPAGSYQLWVMLHDSSSPVGEPFLLKQVDVVAPSHQFKLPAGAKTPADSIRLAAGPNARITLAGYGLIYTENSVVTQFYWQTTDQITTRYKVFAQLLNSDNNLVAQSDAFPAGPTEPRPTTGWLPGEIITDEHTLSLPNDLPPGRYRLITGLYDPLNGRRLPGANEAEETVTDAITVAEITLP